MLTSAGPGPGLDSTSPQRSRITNSRRWRAMVSFSCNVLCLSPWRQTARWIFMALFRVSWNASKTWSPMSFTGPRRRERQVRRRKRKQTRISMDTWHNGGSLGRRLWALGCFIRGQTLFGREESLLMTGANAPILARQASIDTPIFCQRKKRREAMISVRWRIN